MKKRMRAAGYTGSFRTPSRVMVVPRVYGNPQAVTERKYFDTDKDLSTVINIAGASWAGCELDPATVNTLFAPVEGNDFNQRQGRKVQVIQIKIKGFLTCAAQADATAADNANYVRLVFYEDTQTNGAQSQAEEVFASGSATLNNVCAFQNPANFGRFRVLKDRTFTLQRPSMSYDGVNMEQGGLITPFKITHKFKKPVVVSFNAANGGTIADIVNNSWHFIGASSSSGLVPQIAYKCRVTYLDV